MTETTTLSALALAGWDALEEKALSFFGIEPEPSEAPEIDGEEARAQEFADYIGTRFGCCRDDVRGLVEMLTAYTLPAASIEVAGVDVAVGQAVVIIDDSSGHSFKNGETVIVSYFEPSDPDPCVVRGDGSEYLEAGRDYRLATEDETRAYFAQQRAVGASPYRLAARVLG